LIPSRATLAIGQTVSLAATVAPADAPNQNLTWSSSDATVATVSATGASALVTAIASGSVTITVTTQDDHKTATCIVTVGMLAQWVQSPTTANFSSSFAAVAVDSGGNIYTAGTIRGADPYTFSDSVTVHGSSTSSNGLLVKYNSTGAAQWANSVAGEGGASAFTGVATDASGNVFVVGTIAETGSFDFGRVGHEMVVRGTYTFGSSLVLVKYNASGVAQWASTVMNTVIHPMGATSYAAVATDSSGNLYAAGALSDAAPYDLGNEISVSGFVAGGNNALLVKYSPAGAAQWAQSTYSGSGESGFAAVTVDGAGTPYGAGYVAGTVALGFGNAVIATGTGTSNALLVHYNASGVAQWARTAESGGNNSGYTAVAAGNSGIFVAGSIYGNTANSFGSGVNVAGAYAAGASILLVKYSSSGAAQWGHSATSATGLSRFASLALDPAGRLYAAGLLAGPGSYDVGNSIVASTTSNGNEVLLTRYDSAGMCHGAQTAATGSSVSGFSAVAADGAAGVYAAGTINGADPVDFGNSTTVTGAYSGGNNAILVKYQ
jgi:hypothetical protein